ncbi:MAG: O-antigen ligase family protein [Ignavibacteriae bacterium]|nr:O-antigen ligase family protein [Ignavibacteriota bacterium]
MKYILRLHNVVREKYTKNESGKQSRGDLIITKKTLTFSNHLLIMKRKNEQSQAKNIHSRAISWMLVLLFAGTTLVIIPDVNNSTLFKPYILIGFSVLLLTILLHWLLSQERIEFKLHLLTLAGFFLVVTSAVSLLNVYNTKLGYDAFLVQLCLFIVFLSSSFIATSETELGFIFKGLFVVILITFAIGCLQAFQLIPERIMVLSSGRKVLSTLGNATYFAGFLVFLIPIFFGLMLKHKNPTAVQITLSLLFLTALFLLMKTESRSAWFAGLAGITVFVFLNFKSRRQRLLGMGVLLVSVIVGYVLFPEMIQNRIGSMFELTPQSSSARRLYFYEGAWKAFLASPIFGHGIGNFVLFLPKFRAPDYWMYQSEDIVPHAHNEFLEILSETGIVGLSAFLLVIIVFAVQTLKQASDISNPKRTLMIGFFCAIISILLDNVFSLNLRTIPVAVGFWMILGFSNGHVASPLFHRTIQFPAMISKFRWLPVLVLFFSFWWLLPKAISEYKTERTILEGNIFTWNKDERNAKEKFKTALSFDSTHYLARYFIAASCLKQFQYEEARTHALRLIQDYPYAPKTYLLLAVSSFELGDTAQAVEAIQKEIEFENSPQAYYYSAYFASRMGNTVREFDLLETMLNQNIKGKSPEFATMGIERLAMLINKENRQRCLTLFRQINDSFLTDVPILVALAESYFKLDEQAQSLSVLGQVELMQNISEQARTRIEKLKIRIQSLRNQP